MGTLLSILGVLLLLPIGIVLVGLICTTLIGGYVALVLKLFGEVVLFVLLLIIGIKLIKKFL